MKKTGCADSSSSLGFSLPLNCFSFVLLSLNCLFFVVLCCVSFTLSTPEYLETFLQRTDISANSYSYCVIVVQSLRSYISMILEKRETLKNGTDSSE